jgi:hypothetical protein
MPVKSCEFRENRCSERHTFLTGVKEILSLNFWVYIRRNGERPGLTELDYCKVLLLIEQLHVTATVLCHHQVVTLPIRCLHV